MGTTFTWFNIPVIYYLLVLALILPRIPYIGKLFNIINTLIHEFGHALMALLLQGRVYSIEIFGDTSGSATTQTKNKISSFLVSISGYLFASSFAWLSFYLLSAGLHQYYIIGLSALFLVILLLWVRNRFGIIWILTFCVLNSFFIFYLKSDIFTYLIATFYATIILVESLFSTLILLYLSIFKHKESGDALNLQKITHIPAFFWAAIFAAYAIFIVYQIYQQFTPYFQIRF